MAQLIPAGVGGFWRPLDYERGPQIRNFRMKSTQVLKKGCPGRCLEMDFGMDFRCPAGMPWKLKQAFRIIHGATYEFSGMIPKGQKPIQIDHFGAIRSDFRDF